MITDFLLYCVLLAVAVTIGGIVIQFALGLLGMAIACVAAVVITIGEGFARLFRR